MTILAVLTLIMAGMLVVGAGLVIFLAYPPTERLPPKEAPLCPSDIADIFPTR